MTLFFSFPLSSPPSCLLNPYIPHLSFETVFPLVAQASLDLTLQLSIPGTLHPPASPS